jgi:DNA invertase Pin-like site-specific DNA recombinase
MKPSRRVVGYVRISSLKQLKGKGLQEQTNAIELHTRRILNLKPNDRIPKEQFQIYIETPWSGTKGTAGDRPELQAALNDVCGSNGILIVRKRPAKSVL